MNRPVLTFFQCNALDRAHAGGISVARGHIARGRKLTRHSPHLAGSSPPVPRTISGSQMALQSGDETFHVSMRLPAVGTSVRANQIRACRTPASFCVQVIAHVL